MKSLEQLEAELERRISEIDICKEKLLHLKGEYNGELRKYRELRNQRQLEVWAKEGRAPCVKCHHLVPQADLSLLFLVFREPLSHYESSLPKLVKCIQRVCSRCQKEIVAPAHHGAYLARILIEKREDGYYAFMDGRYRPADTMPLWDKVELQTEISIEMVCTQDYVPVGQHFPALYA